MLLHTREITFETCASEREALLRENKLLRSLRPPFNVLNTHPESYVTITWTKTPQGLRFRSTDDPFAESSDTHSSEHVYGVFKSRGAVREAYGALLRLLWMAARTEKTGVDDDGRYAMPGALQRYKPPSPYTIPESILVKQIDGYLAGRSRTLLRELTSLLLLKASIPPYLYPRIQDDLEMLSAFFTQYCAKNRKLCRHFGRKTPFIAHDEIDDWLVAFHHQ
jgi:excinuclease UvrABC nuclease subunit